MRFINNLYPRIGVHSVYHTILLLVCFMYYATRWIPIDCLKFACSHSKVAYLTHPTGVFCLYFRYWFFFFQSLQELLIDPVENDLDVDGDAGQQHHRGQHPRHALRLPPGSRLFYWKCNFPMIRSVGLSFIISYKGEVAFHAPIRACFSTKTMVSSISFMAR